MDKVLEKTIVKVIEEELKCLKVSTTTELVAKQNPREKS